MLTTSKTKATPAPEPPTPEPAKQPVRALAAVLIDTTALICELRNLRRRPNHRSGVVSFLTTKATPRAKRNKARKPGQSSQLRLTRKQQLKPRPRLHPREPNQQTLCLPSKRLLCQVKQWPKSQPRLTQARVAPSLQKRPMWRNPRKPRTRRLPIFTSTRRSL